MVRVYCSLHSTSFPVLVAVNGSIDLVLVVANTFFDTVDLIQHLSTPLPSKRQKADIISKPLFFHAIDNQASNVTIKDVYKAGNISYNQETKCFYRPIPPLFAITLANSVRNF